MAESPVIIDQFRWISLIFGLIALFMCSMLQLEPADQNTPVDPLSEVSIHATDIYAGTLAGEIPPGVEFASLDFMLAGRSSLDQADYTPLKPRKTEVSGDLEAPEPSGPVDLGIDLRY